MEFVSKMLPAIFVMAFVLFVFRLFIVLFAVAAVDFFVFRLPLFEVAAAAVATVFASNSAVLLFVVMLLLLLFINTLLADDCPPVILLMILLSIALVSSSGSDDEFSMFVRVLIYFIAMRSVVIFVNFSLLLAGLLSQNETGTHCRRCSNALFISRIRIRSRALAVFRRYLLNGAAFCLDFGFCALFLLLFVFSVVAGVWADDGSMAVAAD